jgi:hypothetical protein
MCKLLKQISKKIFFVDKMERFLYYNKIKNQVIGKNLKLSYSIHKQRIWLDVLSYVYQKGKNEKNIYTFNKI